MADLTCPQCGLVIADPHPRQRFCSPRCGQQWRAKNGPRCSVEGCDGVADRHGMCQAHYCRVKDGRPIDAPLKRRRAWNQPCDVLGCSEIAKENGLCASHSARLRKHGDVRADVPLKKLAPRGQGSVDSNGYRSIAGRKEHRIVMENVVGRPLRDDEQVHHINGDRLDNRPENLELWVVRRQPPGQRVADRVADALETLERYAPEHLARKDVQLRVA